MMKGLGAAMAYNAAQGTTGKVSRYKATDADYRLTEISISPADNGFVVSCRHEPVRSKNGPEIPYREPSKLVFENAESLIKAFPKMLGHKMSDHST